MVVLALPRLVSGRELASAMVSALGDISDTEVVVDARATVSGTGSFAARLVRDVLATGHGKKLTVVGAPGEFDTYIQEAADKLGVLDQVELQRHLPSGLGGLTRAS